MHTLVPKPSRHLLVCILILTGTFAGCSSTPRMVMDVEAYHASADSAVVVKSFVTVPLGSSVLSEQEEAALLEAIRRSLEARGLTYDEANPDVFVIVSLDTISYSSTSSPSYAIMPSGGASARGGSSVMRLTTSPSGRLMAVGGRGGGSQMAGGLSRVLSDNGAKWRGFEIPGRKDANTFVCVDLSMFAINYAGEDTVVTQTWGASSVSASTCRDPLDAVPVVIDEMMDEFPGGSQKPSRRFVRWKGQGENSQRTYEQVARTEIVLRHAEEKSTSSVVRVEILSAKRTISGTHLKLRLHSQALQNVRYLEIDGILADDEGAEIASRSWKPLEQAGRPHLEALATLDTSVWFQTASPNATQVWFLVRNVEYE